MTPFRKYKMGSRLDFGKYEGKKIRKVIRKDPGYILWCIANVEWFNCTETVRTNAEEAAACNYDCGYGFDGTPFADVDYEDPFIWENIH